MKPIIRVNHLSKQYTIGPAEGASLRGVVASALNAPFRRLRGVAPRVPKTIWALKDVNFEIGAGEVVGIVGNNGAGKSTLLKILSRIVEPTSGRVQLYGRVGSLLEVGTGFHPELTGRENVFLSGAILGMQRAEINRKFAEIVEFAEIEKFLDTPVKYYSSGMYIRLAFSVAVHLEPEILLLDEVLAVGDLVFQQKCFNHMNRLRSNGTTILLVSHAMATVQTICERAIFIHQGQMISSGDPVEVVKAYRSFNRSQEKDKSARSFSSQAAESSDVEILSFEMFGADNTSRRNFLFGEAPRIKIEVYAKQRIKHPLINFGIRRGDGVVVTNFNHWFDNLKIDYLDGHCTIEGWLPPLRLTPNLYEAHVHVWRRESKPRQGDLSRLRPLAYSVFDEFTISGLPLTDQDGVFLSPARKWIFRRGDELVEYTDITPNSLAEAFDLTPPEAVATVASDA